MRRVKQLVHADHVYRNGYNGRGVCAVVLDTGERVIIMSS